MTPDEQSTIEPTESIDAFLEDLARASLAPTGPLLPTLHAGSIIARRYELVRPLGRGAHGVVWSSKDRLTGTEVALKVLARSSPAHAARVCAEVGSLRMLRVPGVVRLLDDGLEGGSLFFVMPLTDGRAFPGVGAPCPWSSIAGVSELLLETMAHVHSAGVVHRDLKPANVLVSDAGRVTVLDFGLALAPTFDGLLERHRVAGTPAYLAPEQADGQEVDARADLYAIGCMLYGALAGRLPHRAADVPALLRAKRTRPPPLRDLAPDVPLHVADTIDALLATSPAERPSSGLDALERLRRTGAPARGADPTGPSLSSVREPLTEEGLRGLFAGTDRLGWAREDAARLLFERTAGDPPRVEAELAAWIRAGWCRWAPGTGLLIDEDAVDRLEMGLEFEPHGRATDEAHAALVSRAERATTLAHELAERGRLGHAAAVLHEALAAVRFVDPRPNHVITRALSLWVEVAVAMGTPRALDQALYEVCRLVDPPPLVTDLEALVRAALAVGAWTPRALDLASEVPPFEDPALERLRHGVRVTAARRVSLEREQEVAESLAAETGPAAPAETRAALAGWLGRLRYRQGRFLECAALHAEAAAGTTWATRRVASLVSQASALMEAFAFDEAAAVAAPLLDLARETRHVYLRAQAGWLVRLLGYRRGELTEPDPGWVEAVAALGMAELEGLVCMTEASIAWRGEDDAAATALASRAKRAWASVGDRGGGLLLASALVVACTPPGGAPPEGEVAALAEQALKSDTPGVGVQVLGLVAPRWQGEPPDDGRVAALAAEIPREHWARRVDILSVDEALARVSAIRTCRSLG